MKKWHSSRNDDIPARVHDKNVANEIGDKSVSN